MGLAAIWRGLLGAPAPDPETDPLTGLANRRRWDHDLADLLAGARSSGVPVAVGLVDVDHLSVHNATRGHAAGDAVLQAVADTLVTVLEGSAPEVLLARWGGEEFAVALSGVGVDDAARCLRAVHAGLPLGVTCSIGVTGWDRAGVPGHVLAQADEALRAAKAAGRDRTTPWTPALSPRAAAGSAPAGPRVRPPG